MVAIGLNDWMTLVNTVLCILLIVLRLFWYRKNPALDSLIYKIDSYLKENLNPSNLPPNLRSDPNLSFPSNGDVVGVQNDNKSNI